MVQLYDKTFMLFFDKIKKDNTFLTKVYWDLQVEQYRIGCSCLGLI